MKIEVKHLELGEKLAKIAIFIGLFLYLLGIVIFGGVLTIIAGIFGLIAIIAYALIMFLKKGESIVKLLVIFGGIGYLFFISLAAVVGGFTAASITLMIVAFLVLAGFIFELVTKNNVKYEKFIPGLMVFIYGFFIGFVFNTTFTTWGVLFPILGVILLGLGVALYLAVFYFKGRKPAE